MVQKHIQFKIIRSGDILVGKVCTLAWKYICKPIEKGGVSLRFAKQFNEALVEIREFLNRTPHENIKMTPCFGDISSD